MANIVNEFSVTRYNWSGIRTVKFTIDTDGIVRNENKTILVCPRCGNDALLDRQNGKIGCACCLSEHDPSRMVTRRLFFSKRGTEALVQ